MDERIGEVLDHLRTLGLQENTIIVFQSDHGHSAEQRTFGGGGNAGPYRGAKFSLFEGGVRVPAVISWPKKIPQAEVRSQLCTAVDWLPTIAQLCDVPLPNCRIDGTSLVEVINDAAAPDAHDVFHWQSGRGFNAQPQWSVRQGRWKLLGNPNDTSKLAPLGDGDELFLVTCRKIPASGSTCGRSNRNW